MRCRRTTAAEPSPHATQLARTPRAAVVAGIGLAAAASAGGCRAAPPAAAPPPNPATPVPPDASTAPPPTPATLNWIAVAPDGRGFVQVPTGRAFVPWGFNYDHDEHQRLLEDYWDTEWSKVVADFHEMRALGANVVRIHLQVARFLVGPTQPNEAALDRLSALLALAERVGLYLDITGLGCYRAADVPAWYDALDEAGRWAAQACFWETIAARAADSPAVFCYDLMNEPVVAGARREPGAWLGPPFADGYHYVQFITLDPAGRPRPEIARAWVRQLMAAIRRHDRRHLVTVGLVDWSLDRPGLTSGFVPAVVAPELDFVAVHLYPQAGRVGEALETLRGFAVGRPVLIEETFPLLCSLDEFDAFLRGSAEHAAGWIGFYWGRTPEECRASGTLPDALMAAWLERFRQGPPPRPGAGPRP